MSTVPKNVPWPYTIRRHSLPKLKRHRCNRRQYLIAAMHRWAIKAGYVVALLVIFVFPWFPALAHDHWINWGDYKDSLGAPCCGEEDCHVVDSSQVKATSRGYELINGVLIQYDEVIQSEDSDYWLCKRPDGTLRCFFAPEPGS